MAFSNYYVGSNLTDLGNNITRDTMSQRENERLMQTALLQALAQRQQHEQAQQQFQQELAFRQQQAQQQNAYQNALLGLKQQEFQQQATGWTPRDTAEQAYRYAALQNALDISKQQAQIPGQQAAAAYINQNGLNFRDQQLAKEAADAENQSSMARAAEYNARAKMIDDAAAEAKAKGSKHWWNSQSTADEESNKIIKQGYADLMMALSQDKRPGTISPDASGRRFVPVQRNVQAPQMFYGGLGPHLQQQLQFGAPATNPPQSALIQALQGTNTLSNTNAPGQTITSPGPSVDYQRELAQLQSAARSNLIDRATYISRRQALDAKYGVLNR